MAEVNIEQARHNMIAQQIRPWSVLDERTLEVMLEIPREDFVPPPYRGLAFTDTEIPLGEDQRMMPPRLEARMLQALNVQPDAKVLEVGTGSGYVTALLARLAADVRSVDILEGFVVAADRRLKEHGFTNVVLDVGDAACGWTRGDPFDAIALTGSVPYLDQRFLDSLKVGGRLFAVVGAPPAMEALLITRLGEVEFLRQALFETELPPLINAPQTDRFIL